MPIDQSRRIARSFVIAWLIALLFYVLEYAVRSSPAVMITPLSGAFGESTVGISAILGSYYFSYSLASLLAGAALDHLAAKYPVSAGAAILAIGCLVFATGTPLGGYVGRLMQGFGSSFAFTGAVYLAAKGFPPRTLATAIGVTQCLGMAGGFIGQFLVGPLLQAGVQWRAFWIFFGVVGLTLAALQFFITPREHATGGTLGEFINPYLIVFSNPQSYLCGLVAGLLFVPTTIFDMTWGLSFFQHDEHLAFNHAVTVISMAPLGWVLGCPLLGWLADRLGVRKPVIYGGAATMALAMAQVTFAPHLLPPALGMLVLGVASGAAMIPYAIIKEANPDEVKGCATGSLNFLVFGLSAVIGLTFTKLIGSTLETTTDHAAHFREAGLFWICAIVVAIVSAAFLQETGHKAAGSARAAGPPGDGLRAMASASHAPEVDA